MTRDLLSEFVELVAAEVAARLGPPPSPPPPEEPWRLLDVEEAAARLGRSTRWIRERAKRGELPHIRLDGGALAFDVDDLRAFARARRVPAEDGDPLAGRLHPLGNGASGADSATGQRVGNRRVPQA